MTCPHRSGPKVEPNVEAERIAKREMFSAFSISDLYYNGKNKTESNRSFPFLFFIRLFFYFTVIDYYFTLTSTALTVLRKRYFPLKGL